MKFPIALAALNSGKLHKMLIIQDLSSGFANNEKLVTAPETPSVKTVMRIMARSLHWTALFGRGWLLGENKAFLRRSKIFILIVVMEASII